MTTLTTLYGTFTVLFARRSYCTLSIVIGVANAPSLGIKYTILTLGIIFIAIRFATSNLMYTFVILITTKFIT